MKLLLIISVLGLLNGCVPNNNEMKKILFLHHSTGNSIWVGKTNKYLYKITQKGDVQKFFDAYNRKTKTSYIISERVFPKKTPYGWNNYPFDYYNIWVKNAGQNPYMEEPTLEMLTSEFDIIIFKHCYPVSKILEDTGNPDIDSSEKRAENYKLQYNALKHKLYQFPEKKFIIWTPAANTKALMTEEEAIRTQQFYRWMIDVWDEKGDNIFIWDFYKYETEGSLFLADKNALSPNNSHPDKKFSARMASSLGEFIINVIQSVVK